MIMKALNEHLEMIAGYVFDNDKLVTYKWLSKELQIHVNIAKQILWEFYQTYHKTNDIECTHLLIGHLKDKGMRVEIVRVSDISKAKEKYSKIISEHVYSVHKPITDLELLATSGSGDVKYSAIKCDACKKRSDEEMQLLRWGAAANNKVAAENTNSKSTVLTNPPKAEKNLVTAKKNGFNNLFNMAGKSKSPENLKSTQKNDKDLMKKDINSKEKDLVKKNKDSVERKKEALMEADNGLTEKEKDIAEKDKNCIQKNKDVSKDSEKIKTKKNKGSNSIAKKVSPQSNSVKKVGLDNFFGKVTSPSKSIGVTSLAESNNNAEKEFTEGKETKEKKNSHGRKRNRSKETDKIAKKRKRIVVQNDSSDSEIQSDVEIEESVSEMELETPAKPKSPSPPRVKHENGKRKVLKLVNKTYKEGEYIVTKKEHVYVSCSEDEEEKQEEARRKEKKVETKTEKIKKKQSTLTDFFKKS
ncbi:DNA polymerase delta subunit 3 [Monomorium pharaonis]|uniref:DNA polymerase delta subunit 3 n=1 Tax=Monomorium pharaonis TaxID=307658 RepID=UPI00063FAC18|nr:DNA polymerase delta subunit 3 [Monomorium pharaonis]